MSYLYVEYQGEVIGRAVVDEYTDRFAFVYDSAWLARANAFPISASLPLRQEIWPADRAHVFFANLLPEGLAREAICNRLGVSVDNDTALLRALGDDTAGAFRFVSPSYIRGDGDRQRQLIALEELEEWASGAPAFLAHSEHPPRLSLAGAQHKASVVRVSSGYALPAWSEASTHILKFDSPRFSHLAANEYLTTRFAAELGLRVVASRLDTRTSPPMLVIDRYDRIVAGESVRRVHQEDFCQILGLLPTRKYEADGGPSLAQIAHRLRQLSASPAADILELIRWVIFCAIGGNADGHAKNLSMLYGPRGPRLAPAYDLVCTRAYPRLDSRLAFTIGGERNPDRLKPEHWEKFAADIAVKPRLVLGQLEKLIANAEPALQRASDHLREQVGESHAIQHVGPAIRKRIRAIGVHV